MPQFIGYCIDHDRFKFVPIAVATTKAECLGIATQRALANCWIDDSIQIQQRDEIPADVFAKLGEVLASCFGPDHCYIEKANRS